MYVFPGEMGIIAWSDQTTVHVAVSQMPLYNHPSESWGLRIPIEHQSHVGENCPLLGVSLDLAVLRTCLLVMCWIPEQVQGKEALSLKEGKISNYKVSIWKNATVLAGTKNYKSPSNDH